MRHADNMRLSGRVTITARDSFGRVVSRQCFNNLVTLAGRNLVRDLLRGESTLELSHFAVGTGTAAAAATDTALGAEVHRDLITQTTVADGQLTERFYLPSTAANGSTLTEAGLFTAASGGTLYARVTHAGIAKTSSIAVSYDWVITIGAS
jgi:hypothetical protein